MDYFENELKEKLGTLDLRLKKLDAKIEAIKDLEYEKGLIEKDIADYIKFKLAFSYASVFGIPVEEDFSRACWWSEHKNDSLVESLTDEEKKKFEKSFDYIANRVEYEFTRKNKDFELVSICGKNNNECYEFEYKYKGVNLLISMMNFARPNAENLKSFLKPYTVYCEDGENGWLMIFEENDWRNIYNKILEWYKNYKEEAK